MSVIDAVLAQARLWRQLPAPAVCRALREAAGLSQGAVGRVIGTSAVSVSRYENGQRRPRGPHLGRYVELLEALARDGAGFADRNGAGTR